MKTFYGYESHSNADPIYNVKIIVLNQIATNFSLMHLIFVQLNKKYLYFMAKSMFYDIRLHFCS